MARTLCSSARRRALAGWALALAAGAAGSAAAQTMSFGDALAAARQNDAQFRAAGHELEAVRLGVPVARAALLPAVSLNAATAEVVGQRQFPNSLNQDVRVRVEYATPQASLSARMPIFNPEARSRLGQAEAQVDVAEALYRQRGLELIDRTASAYLAVLLALDGRVLAEQQKAALEVQVAQARQRFERGEGTRVDVAQSLAALDAAQARLVDAADQVTLAQRQLRKVTGAAAPGLRALRPDAALPPLVPDRLGDWLEIAARQSPVLGVRERTLSVAQFAVQRNRAGHLPRLDAVASLSRSQNESLSSLNQTSVLRSIGVQLSVPIYNGGGVDASVRQSMAELARAEEDLRTEKENVELEVQRQFQATTSANERIAALKRAVDSSELAVTGLRRAFEAGLATSQDVADAQARLYGARRELSQARMEQLLARARLMISAGMPAAEIADELDRALTMAATLGATS